jgi:hypothetical protein
MRVATERSGAAHGIQIIVEAASAAVKGTASNLSATLAEQRNIYAFAPVASTQLLSRCLLFSSAEARERRRLRQHDAARALCCRKGATCSTHRYGVAAAGVALPRPD